MMPSPKFIFAAGVAAVVATPLLLGVVLLTVFGTAPAATTGPPPGGEASGALNASAVPNRAWVPWLLRAGRVCAGITAPELAAQIRQESVWNPGAVSPVGAEGISQFMPGTWVTYGKDVNHDGTASPFDPPDAIMAQGHDMCDTYATVAHWKQDGQLHTQTSTWELALAAYNAGDGAVLQAGGIPPIAETETYVAAVQAFLPLYTAAPPRTGPPGTPPPGGTGPEAAALHVAYRQIGLPYCWGGGTDAGPTEGLPTNGPTGGGGRLSPGCSSSTPGFDCSGLVMYAFWAGAHIQLPRSANDDAHIGQAITRAQLRPGDLIAFSTDGGFYEHVGFYYGNGQLLNAPEDGEKVSIMPLSGWANETWSIRRVTGPGQ